MAANIEVIVTAKDEATRVLQVVQRQMEIFPEFARTATITGASVDRATRSLEGFDFSATKASRAIRALAVPIASELSPALGTLGSQMAGVITGAVAIGSGFGALAIGGAALVGILGGKLVQSWRDSAAAAESYARAVRVGDIAALTQAVSTQADEVIRLSREYRELAAAAARARQEAAGGGPEAAGVAGAASFFAAQAGGQAEAKRQELLAKQRELDLAKQSQGEAAALLQAERDLKKIEEDRAALRFANTLADRGLGDFRLDPIQQAFRAQLRQAEDRANAGDPAGAARLRQNAVEVRQLALGTRFAAGAPVNPFETAAGQEAERRAQEGLVVGDEAARQARIQEFLARAPVNPFETEAGQETERRAREQLMVRDEQQREQAAARALAANLALLDADRQRADILGQLTPDLEAQLALRERELLLNQENLTDEEKRLINARAEVALLERMVAMDPVAGLTRGFSDAANRAQQWGTELEQVARETDRTMSRTFSDGLFNLFTGRKGEDLGRQFGESLLRSVTDLVGRQLSGTVSGLFSNLLRGFVPGTAAVGGRGGGFDLLSLLTGSGGGGSAIISPTGAPAGTLVMTQAGLVQVTPSGALQLVQGGGGGGFSIDQGVGLLTQANTLSGQLGGPTLGLAGAGTGYLSALAATPISSILQYGLTTAVAQTQAGVALGFGASAGGTTFAVAGPTAGAPLTSTGLSATSTGTTAGATVGGAATGVLAAVALGFTIYGGLTQEQTAQNIAMNAISGAISGAILGAVIGSIVPGIGTVIGGVIGAIAGGAAAGGTTGLKAPKKMSTSEKSLRIAEAAAGSLSSAIGQAASIEDLVTIFNTQWAPGVNILTTYQGVTYWAGDYDDPAGPAATVELMIIPEFLDALEIQVGEAGAPRRRQDLIDKFRRKRDEILGILSNIPFGILESDRAAGVSRRTYLPFQQIYGIKAGTQQLIGSSEFYRRDLGGEDETIDFLLDRLRERSIRRDVDLTRDEFLFR